MFDETYAYVARIVVIVANVGTQQHSLSVAQVTG